MLRKGFFLLAFLFLASTLVMAQTTEDSSVVLQWKFKKGETLLYRDNVNLEIEVSMPMGNQTGKVEMLMEYALTVKDVDSNGTASIDMKVKRVKMVMDMGPGVPATNFDTDKKEDMGKLDSLPPQMASIPKLLKRKIKVKVDKSGRVQKVEGLEDLKGAGSMGGLDKSSLEEIFVGFPMGPISQGAEWTKNLMRNMMNMGVEVESTYALQSQETKNGKKCASIENKEKWKLNMKNNPMAQHLKINVKKAGGKGKILFSLDDGKVLSKSMKANLEVSLSGNMGGQQMSIEQKVKMTRTFELISSK